MPAVSVIILAWNSGRYLLTSAGSILDQTMQDLELVLVDNGSTDGAVDELLRARPDPRMRVFRQEKNLGIGGGINLAASHASSPWVAIMDSDDWAHPMRLELQLQAAVVDPTLAVIGTGARWMDERGTPGAAYPMFYEPAEIAAYIPWGMPVLHPSLMIRREVLLAVPYRRGLEQASDYDWLSRVAEEHRIGVVSLPLVHYRRHGDSVTIKNAKGSLAAVSALRLAVARRRAGRPDHHEELIAEAHRWSRKEVRMEEMLTHFSALAAAEGFPLLAAFHAALAVRMKFSIVAQLRFWRYLLRAIVSDRGAWREALKGAGKGPFWVMLKRAGFPPFPRY